jgi:HEPN domain-containing protein
MGVNGVSSAGQTYESGSTSKAQVNQNAENKQTKPEETPAAVYEKSEPITEAPKKTYTRDEVTINRLKAEADRRTQSLRQLVQKLLIKQGETYNDSTDIYQMLREGKVSVDDETRAQAQKDIAEDGYWGVEQTSNRLVEFAKAISGEDPAKADKLIEAVKKGLEEAKKAWGGELPEICQRTIDTTIKKLEEWRDGTDKKDDGTNKKK